MCIIETHKYSCGCKRNGEFKQCEKRSGTNVKCSPVTQVARPDILHYCAMHMVPPDSTAAMHRDPQPAIE